MSFITGLILIDAPASTLNNSQVLRGGPAETLTQTKTIETRAREVFPYVSAQSFRYWLRHTLQAKYTQWRVSPIEQVSTDQAYTDADPVTYWDDDLFGYMRAPKTTTGQEKKGALTRCSPFRVSTLIAVAPAVLTEDWGTLSRHEGTPVLHQHQFYRTVLKGLFSLNLSAAGTFSYQQRTGFLNLDKVRKDKAEEMDLEHLEDEKAYRLPLDQRQQRVATLLRGMAELEGGANQTLHYTDVSPSLLIAAVTAGGNHPFAHCIGAASNGLPRLNLDALAEVLAVFADQIQSPIYFGWAKGFMDDERAAFESWLDGDGAAWKDRIIIEHPKVCLTALAEAVQSDTGGEWFA